MFSVKISAPWYFCSLCFNWISCHNLLQAWVFMKIFSLGWIFSGLCHPRSNFSVRKAWMFFILIYYQTWKTVFPWWHLEKILFQCFKSIFCLPVAEVWLGRERKMCHPACGKRNCTRLRIDLIHLKNICKGTLKTEDGLWCLLDDSATSQSMLQH